MIPFGYCECGCGERTKLAPRTNRTKGWIEGRPLRFILGHSVRTRQLGYVVDEATGCWNAEGRDNDRGYVQIRRDGQRVYAHRWHYEQAKGPIPDGLDLDHLCRNRRCVNPAHLEAVPPKVNSNRGLRTKLSDEQVAAIRASGLDRVGVAERFGIAPSHAGNILAGRRRAVR